MKRVLLLPILSLEGVQQQHGCGVLSPVSEFTRKITEPRTRQHRRVQGVRHPGASGELDSEGPDELGSTMRNPVSQRWSVPPMHH